MRRLAVLLICLLAMAMMIPMKVTAQMEVPELEVGNTWVYDVNLNLEGMAILTGDWTYTIDAIGQASGHEVYEMSIGMSQVGAATIPGFGTGTYSIEGLNLLRTSDLSVVREEIAVNITTSIGPQVYYIQVNMNTSFDPPMNQFDFPIDVDEVWSSTTNVTSELFMASNMIPGGIPPMNVTAQQTIEFECTSEESVTVPAGDYDSYKIEMEEEDGNRTSTYLSPEIGYMVKMTMFNESDAQVGNMRLIQFSYTPPPEEEYEPGFLDYLWIVIIIVIVVVVILGILVARPKRPKAQPEAPKATSPGKLLGG